MARWRIANLSGALAALVLAAGTLTAAPLAADGTPAGTEQAGKFKIEDLSWLSGRWASTLNGATYDEIYSEPRSGSMMGIYRVIREERVLAYGIMAITETDDGIVFRYRLVGTDLKPLEGHDRTAEKRLLALSDKTAEFEDMRFELVNPSKMTLDYTERKNDGTKEVRHFVYYRPCAGFCMMP